MSEMIFEHRQREHCAMINNEVLLVDKIHLDRRLNLFAVKTNQVVPFSSAKKCNNRLSMTIVEVHDVQAKD